MMLKRNTKKPHFSRFLNLNASVNKAIRFNPLFNDNKYCRYTKKSHKK